MSARLASVWPRVAEALRPPPVEPFSAWVERTVRLPEGSAEPGPVRLWSPQGGIADSIGDPDVERVTWPKAVRSGFTFLLACAVARHVCDDAAPIMLMPTENDARFSVKGPAALLAQQAAPDSGHLFAAYDETRHDGDGA